MPISATDKLTMEMTVEDLFSLMTLANQQFGVHQAYGHTKVIRQNGYGTLTEIYSVQIKRPGKDGVDVKSFNAKKYARRPDRIWKWLGPKIEAWNSWAAKQKK